MDSLDFSTVHTITVNLRGLLPLRRGGNSRAGVFYGLSAEDCRPRLGP